MSYTKNIEKNAFQLLVLFFFRAPETGKKHFTKGNFTFFGLNLICDWLYYEKRFNSQKKIQNSYI